MFKIRRANERGEADLGWLYSQHTFSFGEYYDPEHMGFGTLRVINEDRVQPGKGFGAHGHQNMEIISYVLAGSLEHQDSLGNGSIIEPGDVQRMSAGTGVRHSEFNPSHTELVHFLQIWILPEREGLEPSYEQIQFSEAQRRGRLRLIGSPDGRDGSVTIHQDVGLYSALLSPSEVVIHELSPERNAWVQVARGSVIVNGANLEAGDGAAVAETNELTITAVAETELLLFDMRGAARVGEHDD
ncbi:MAG: pirin family protein [Pseudomonadota bacterium]